MKQRVRTMLPLAVVLALMLSLLPVQTFAQEGLSAKADLVETAIAAGDRVKVVAVEGSYLKVSKA